MENHYETLGIEPFSDYDTISKTYKRLALQYHPDKASQQGRSAEDESFIRIQRAWEVLRDENKRKDYDKQLTQEQTSSSVAVSAEVDLDDMEYSDETAEYRYPCRCGDKFVVTEEELESGIDLVLCRSCSFAVRVIYQKDDTG